MEIIKVLEDGKEVGDLFTQVLGQHSDNKVEAISLIYLDLAGVTISHMLKVGWERLEFSRFGRKMNIEEVYITSEGKIVMTHKI